MKHLIYNMRGSAPPPAGYGDTTGWFLRYKWDVDGQVYVPWTKETIPEVGDILWFALDGAVLGCAPVLRVTSDDLNGRLEVWYVGNQVCKVIKYVDVAMNKDSLTPEEGSDWLNNLLEKNPLAN